MLETKIVEDIKVVLKMDGDYVAFHEVCLRFNYVFGETSALEIVELIIDDDNTTELVREQCITFLNKKDLSKEEQEQLDIIVKGFVDDVNFEDGCDYGDYEVRDAIRIDNKIYINVRG